MKKRHTKAEKAMIELALKRTEKSADKLHSMLWGALAAAYIGGVDDAGETMRKKAHHGTR